EYHDGQGNVWRFYPEYSLRDLEDDQEDPEGLFYAVEESFYDELEGSTYYGPRGVYLTLEKLAGDLGWRLVGRNHQTALFDSHGRLSELNDRHRGTSAAPGEQGNTLGFEYDLYGQLALVRDDLGRCYRFEYYDDPNPDSEFGAQYGLLRSITDFQDRKVLEYEYTEDRLLEKVRLPEIETSGSFAGDFTYTDEDRPTISYEYEVPPGLDNDDRTDAVLHGDFAQLRLKGYKLPEYQGSDDSLRVRLSYGATSGRVEAIAFPASTFAGNEVEWEIDSGDSGEPATEATITAPWGQETEYDISEKGRTERITLNSVPVHDRGSATAQNLETEFAYICEGTLDTCNDGRLESVTGADGSQQINCYVDSEQGGCGDLSGSRHRLALAN
ncbi:MAG: hypothetical protein GY835_22235, partial [bacterium]|nr:hypothetical protein [bacterium]